MNRDARGLTHAVIVSILLIDAFQTLVYVSLDGIQCGSQSQARVDLSEPN
jgi:hypothetical protein